MGKLAKVPCLKFLHLGGVTIGDGVLYTNHEHTSCLSLRHHKPAGTIAGMVPIMSVLCQQSKSASQECLILSHPLSLKGLWWSCLPPPHPFWIPAFAGNTYGLAQAT